MPTVDEHVIAKAKAEREAAEAAARTAAHVEEAARLADLKAAAELEEWKLGAAHRKRIAELAVETTQLENVAKLQTAAGNVTPDLKGLERGKTAVPEENVLYSALLTTRALTDAASKVAKLVKSTTVRPYRIFLTSDPDLLSRDAQLRSLVSRMSTLTTFVQRFSASCMAANTYPESEEDGGLSILTAIGPANVVTGAATALAKLIPGIVELLAANRTLTVKPLTINEEQAVTAVAGALSAIERDDFLKFDDTRFLSGDSKLQQQRDDLEAALITLQAIIAQHAKWRDAAWLTEAEAVTKAGLDALIALDTVSPGAQISPLAAAMATELIRESGLEFILIVQPAGSSATQLVSDRPLSIKDPFYITGTVALSYRLIKCDTSQIVSSGVVAGSAALTGSVGSKINLDGEPY